MGIRWSICVAMAAAVAWSTLAAVPASSETRITHVGTLTVGKPLFWDGPQGVDHVRAELGCVPTDGGNCWIYAFDIGTQAASELRVAAQASMRSDFWSIAVFPPGEDPVDGTAAWADGNAPFAGIPVSVSNRLGDQKWGIEGRLALGSPDQMAQRDAEKPANHSANRRTWHVRLIVQDTETRVQEAELPLGFELRAALDPGADVTGPPNLRPRPPYELGLAAPANPGSGAAIDRHNPALSAGGKDATSCTWDEVVLAAEHEAEDAVPEGDGIDDPPTRCLRFSVGVYEAGEGRMELQLDGYNGGFPDDEGTVAHSGTVTQRIHWGPADVETHDGGGTWEFHMTHGHAHYLGLVQYELDEVTPTDDGVELRHVDTSRKTGYYTADQRIAEWQSFAQDAQWSALAGCASACIALGAGWEDQYRWQRPGQYVEVPEGDGLYVLRIAVNANEELVETTTEDNTAYALVRVTADGRVAVCERGLGDHPWADNAQPVEDQWTAVGVRFGAPTASSC